MRRRCLAGNCQVAERLLRAAGLLQWEGHGRHLRPVVGEAPIRSMLSNVDNQVRAETAEE